MPTIDELIDEHWHPLVADFAEVYGIRLHRTANDDMTWHEFTSLLGQLLATPNARLFRHFARKHADDDPADDDPDRGDDL